MILVALLQTQGYEPYSACARDKTLEWVEERGYATDAEYDRFYAECVREFETPKLDLDNLRCWDVSDCDASH